MQGDMAQLWAGMAAMSLVEGSLVPLVEQLLQCVTDPVLKGGCRCAIGVQGVHACIYPAADHLYTAHECTESGWHSLTLTQCEAAVVEDEVLACLTYFTDVVMGHNAQCMAMLAKHMWPAIAAQYVSSVLEPRLQQHKHDTAALQGAAASASALELSTVKLGMAPSAGPGPLATAAKHAIDSLLHAKRTAIVAQARAILLTADVDQEVVRVGQPLPMPQYPALSMESPLEEATLDWGPPGEEAPLTATGLFSVTPAATRLGELALQAVQQGIESDSDSTAHSMCLAVADIATLVMTVPPVLMVWAVCNGACCVQVLGMCTPLDQQHTDSILDQDHTTTVAFTLRDRR